MIVFVHSAVAHLIRTRDLRCGQLELDDHDKLMSSTKSYDGIFGMLTDPYHSRHFDSKCPGVSNNISDGSILVSVRVSHVSE